MIYRFYIFVSILCLASAIPAQAGRLGDCIRWLRSFEEPKAPVEEPSPLADPDYLAFKRQQKKDREALPPVKLRTTATSETELLKDFGFWWYPDNQFYELMIEDFEGLAFHALQGGSRKDYNPATKPFIEEPKSENKVLRLSKAPQYVAFMRELKLNPNALPPSMPNTPQVNEIDLHENFYFWWYPNNKFEKLMTRKFPRYAHYLRIGGESLPGPLTAEELESEILRQEEYLDKGMGDVVNLFKTPLEAPEISEENINTSPTKDMATSSRHRLSIAP